MFTQLNLEEKISSILLQVLRMNYNLIRSIPNQHMDSHRGMVYLMRLKSQNVSSVNERLRERMKLVLSSCSFWYYNVLLAFRLPLQMGD